MKVFRTLETFVAFISKASSFDLVDITTIIENDEFYRQSFLISALNENFQCNIPSFLTNIRSNAEECITSTLSNNVMLKKVAAENIALPVRFTKSEILDVPKFVQDNLISSYLYLVQSRIESMQKAMKNHKSYVDNHHLISEILLGRGGRFFKPSTYVTSFRLVDNEIVHLLNNTMQMEESTNENRIATFPMIFEAVIDLDVADDQSQQITSNVNCPCTITAIYSEQSLDGEDEPRISIKGIDVNLESNFLIEKMIDAAISAANRLFMIALRRVQLNKKRPETIEKRSQKIYGYDDYSHDDSCKVRDDEKTNKKEDTQTDNKSILNEDQRIYIASDVLLNLKQVVGMKSDDNKYTSI